MVDEKAGTFLDGIDEFLADGRFYCWATLTSSNITLALDIVLIYISSTMNYNGSFEGIAVKSGFESL